MIARDILAALAGIRQVDGYYTDAGLWASRRRVPIETWNKSRGAEVTLFTGGEQRIDGCMGSYASRAEFSIVGYISAKDIDRAVILIEADIKRAVLGNQSANGTHTQFDESVTDYQELVDQDVGMVGLKVSVDYEWTLASL